MKKNQENFVQQLIDHGTQVALAHGVSDSKQVKEWEEYKKDIHKISLMDSLPFLSNIIQQMSIGFLCTPDVKRHPFITSDEPCVLFNPDLQWQRFYGPGFAQQNVQLTMPLSPEITVIFSWANYHGYSMLPVSRVEDLNRMARSYAEKEFISSTPRRRLVWFFKIPLDPAFIFRLIKYKIRILIHDWKMKRVWKKHDRKYGKN